MIGWQRHLAGSESAFSHLRSTIHRLYALKSEIQKILEGPRTFLAATIYSIFSQLSFTKLIKRTICLMNFFDMKPTTLVFV